MEAFHYSKDAGEPGGSCLSALSAARALSAKKNPMPERRKHNGTNNIAFCSPMPSR